MGVEAKPCPAIHEQSGARLTRAQTRAGPPCRSSASQPCTLKGSSASRTASRSGAWGRGASPPLVLSLGISSSVSPVPLWFVLRGSHEHDLAEDHRAPDGAAGQAGAAGGPRHWLGAERGAEGGGEEGG